MQQVESAKPKNASSGVAQVILKHSNSIELHGVSQIPEWASLHYVDVPGNWNFQNPLWKTEVMQMRTESVIRENFASVRTSTPVLLAPLGAPDSETFKRRDQQHITANKRQKEFWDSAQENKSYRPDRLTHSLTCDPVAIFTFALRHKKEDLAYAKQDSTEFYRRVCATFSLAQAIVNTISRCSKVVFDWSSSSARVRPAAKIVPLVLSFQMIYKAGSSVA